MDSEEADHSFGSVRLTEGDIDNSELSSEEEIVEGAVGFSPTQDHWLMYALNEPAYVEETDGKPGNNFNLNEKRLSSTSTSYENTPQGLRERPVYSQRRHSFSGVPVRRQSLPGLVESDLFSCQSPLARQAHVFRRSDNGMMRQESVPSFLSNRQNLVRVRQNSLQMDRLLFREGTGLTPSGLRSTHNQYAIMNPPNDSARMGSDLFMMYLREEMERSEIQSPREHLPQFSRSTLENGEFVQIGTRLRYMADEFSKSDQRRRVRERADSVNLSTLDFNSFSDLLFGTFQQGGMTSERVLVLFTFCTDLAIRALREKLQTRFYELTQWSQQYITSWLSPWVQYHGGWAVVLEHSVSEVYKVAVIGVCFMGMIAFWVYIRNNCR